MKHFPYDKQGDFDPEFYTRALDRAQRGQLDEALFELSRSHPDLWKLEKLSKLPEVRNASRR